MSNSIKTKIIFLTSAVCLLCLSVFLLISYYHSYHIVKQEANSKLTETVSKNASEMNTWFSEQRTVLDVIAKTIEIDNNYSDTFLLNYLTQMLKQQDSSMVIDYYLGFVDPQRKFIDGSGWVPPADFDRYSRKWYQGAIQNNGVVFTTPYLDASTQSMIVTIAEPVRQNNRIVAVVAADIKISNLMEITRRTNENNINYAFLMDQEGNFLVHPHRDLQPSANELKNAGTALNGLYQPLLGNHLQDTNQLLELKDFDGQEKYFILSNIKTSNWTFGVAVSKQEYNKPLKRILIGFVIALAIAIATAFLIIRWAVDKFLQPVKTLKEVVNRFTQKDFTARMPVITNDEIGELGNCFNNMAATIEDYNHNLEELVAIRTQELEERNERIMESIDYASRIQQSILPDLYKYRCLSDEQYFVIWMPRDVVGGDLYWSKQVGQDYFMAVFDCTGHGVPGALMTMTVNALLDRIIDETGKTDPACILGELNRLLQETLRQNNADAITNDGVDLGLCHISPGQNRLVFAGARTSLFYCRQGEIVEIKGNRQSLGYKQSSLEFVYQNHALEIEADSIFYLTTDGFLDQNGEEKNISFGTRRFKQMLLDHHHLSLPAQKEKYLQILNQYMGNLNQRDDIAFVGFKIKL